MDLVFFDPSFEEKSQTAKDIMQERRAEENAYLDTTSSERGPPKGKRRIPKRIKQK